MIFLDRWRNRRKPIVFNQDTWRQLEKLGYTCEKYETNAAGLSRWQIFDNGVFVTETQAFVTDDNMRRFRGAWAEDELKAIRKVK